MRKLVLTLALLLAILAALACWAEFSTIAAIAETRWSALVLAVVAAALFASLARRGRGPRRGALLGLAASIAVAGFAAKLAFFTYRETELAFDSAGVVLRGTLFAPRAAGPHPAMVFLHGSGSESRQEFFYVAKLLARHGIAGLAYDKRGAGASGGSTWETDYSGYAADALAAIQALADRPEIDPERIGLLGHSEGGWVAPLVVERRPQTAFVIVTSTTHLSPAEQVIYETGADLREAGFPDEAAERAEGLQRWALEFDRRGGDPAALDAALAEAAREPWFADADLPTSVDPGLDVTWWRSVMDFDALPHWRRVRCPVLMVSGGRDPKSDVEASQREIAAALAAGGNPDVAGRIFPEMEHGTIEWWLPARLPPPRFPAGYPELLVEWTRERVGLGPGR